MVTAQNMGEKHFAAWFKELLPCFVARYMYETAVVAFLVRFLLAVIDHEPLPPYPLGMPLVTILGEEIELKVLTETMFQFVLEKPELLDDLSVIVMDHEKLALLRFMDSIDFDATRATSEEDSAKLAKFNVLIKTDIRGRSIHSQLAERGVRRGAHVEVRVFRGGCSWRRAPRRRWHSSCSGSARPRWGSRSCTTWRSSTATSRRRTC